MFKHTAYWANSNERVNHECSSWIVTGGFLSGGSLSIMGGLLGNSRVGEFISKALQSFSPVNSLTFFVCNM